jgi:3-deoxy-D-manno-octulosonic-acid transferase
MRPATCANRLWLSFSLLAWALLCVAIAPYLMIHKVRRYLKHRKGEEIDSSRWHIDVLGPRTDTAGTKIAFVGASDGEFLIMRQVAESLLVSRPSLEIAYTLRDRKTVSMILESHPNHEVSYWPFDFIIPVANYLRKVRPDVLVLTERYRFPTLVVGAALCGVKVILVNGRLKRGLLDRWVLRHVHTVLVRGEDDATWANTVCDMMAPANAVGDIKLELKRSELSHEHASDLANWLCPDSEVPLVASGSTDSLAEDAWVLDAFLYARETQPMRLLIAPRQVERSEELIEMLTGQGLRVRSRSGYGSEMTPGEEDVLVLDTMGELSHVYGHVTAAYVGGSWDGMGHNVAEPVSWGVPVAYGMRRGHFEEIQLLCEKHEVGFRVGDSAQLGHFFSTFAADASIAETTRERCEALERERSGAFHKTVSEILRALDRREQLTSLATATTRRTI